MALSRQIDDGEQLDAVEVTDQGPLDDRAYALVDTAAVVLDLAAAGRYTYWCAIPGHRSTMEGTLEVIE